MSQEENDIFDKISKEAKATILGNAKHPIILPPMSIFIILPLLIS